METEIPPHTVLTTTNPAGASSPQSTAARESQEVSRTMAVVTVVEKSLLQTLAFLLYQLDRNQAKYCASSILQWYFHLQTQLPDYAVESLDKVADSLIALSDAKFTKYWLSLLDEGSANCKNSTATDYDRQPHVHESDESEEDEEEQHVVLRLYQRLLYRIQRFFTHRPSDQCRAQTPCTSPMEEREYASVTSSYQRRRRRANSYVLTYADEEEDDDMTDYDLLDQAECIQDDRFEPGWAVEYMEQDSHVPAEMSRLMQKMMHSTIPLSLFRVKVQYNTRDEIDICGENGFVGSVTPESIAPTPITRDLQTRRMHRYTTFVLDHTTLVLRLLETNCSS